MRKRYAVTTSDNKPMHTFWTLLGARRFHLRCIDAGESARLFESDGVDWCEMPTPHRSRKPDTTVV